MSLMRKLAGLAALALAGTSGSAAAQEIVLYDMQGYGGQSVRITGDTRNLTSMRFNDRASSLRIVSGTWEICVHENYGGECIIYNNDERDLGRFSNQFTSLRPAAPDLEGGRGGRRGSLTLYSGPNYTGRSVTLDHEEPNFDRIGFNDLARSARYDGRRSWRVCQHANYGGACMEINGDIPVLSGGMAGQISSAEPDNGTRRGGNRPRNGVWLYDGRDFTGQRYDVESDIPDLARYGFNDRADSLIVARGETWEVCEDSHYRGRCEYFDRERFEDLGQLRLRNEISSLRRVDGYGGGYPGGGGYGRIDLRGGVQGVSSTYFPRPEINGYPVDRCLGSSGRECDAVAADRICRAAGYREAAWFNIDRTRNYRTWYMGERRQCTSGRCEPIIDLLCSQ